MNGGLRCGEGEEGRRLNAGCKECGAQAEPEAGGVPAACNREEGEENSREPDGEFIRAEEGERGAESPKIKDGLVEEGFAENAGSDPIAGIDHFLCDGGVETFIGVEEGDIHEKDSDVGGESYERDPLDSRRKQFPGGMRLSEFHRP